MRLSLCMIVRNEQHFLEEALASARPHVEEIVVVDTGSVDDSISIARAAGARVVKLPTRKFVEARNLCIESATGDWILFLDADERMTGDHLIQLRALAGQEEFGAWRLDQYNYFGNGLWSSIPILRLFRRHPDVRFEGGFHENIVPSILQGGLRIGRSRLIIHHVALGGPDNSLEKRRRNLLRMEAHLKDNPPDARFHALSSLEYFALGEV